MKFIAIQGTALKGTSVKRALNSLSMNCWPHYVNFSNTERKGLETLNIILKTVSSPKSSIYGEAWPSGSSEEVSKSPVSKKLNGKTKSHPSGCYNGWMD